MKVNLVGQPAPHFKLETDAGDFFDSTSLNGTWRVVFFYSRHNSPTCKRGCLTFKQQHDLFQSAGCSVVGIGPGTVEEQASFKLGLGDLPFQLLSDPGRTVGMMYNVPMHLGQFPAKSSFLIDPNNNIHYVYDWLFRPRRHVAKILAEISKVTGDD
ncbi:MAG TPA: redoxin domain-containing protein [Poseidonia sp.]|nr:redoxin domain-containing protein [Poseidonia sp.]